MVQASGANAYVSYVDSVAWPATPGAPAMKKLIAATSEDLGGDIEEVVSQALNGYSTIANAEGGNIVAGGSIPFELPLLGFAGMLKHAIGPSNTTGAGPYTHVLKRAASLGEGFTVEVGMPDVTQYKVIEGCMINALNIAIASSGYVTGSMDILASKELALSATSLGVPTEAVFDPFIHHQVAMKEGGAAAEMTSFDMALTNGLGADTFVIGSRYRHAIPTGQRELTGSFSMLFEDGAMHAKWLASTETSLQTTMTTASGSVDILLPRVAMFGAGGPRASGKDGILQNFTWRAMHDSVEGSDIKVTVINTEATI